jgi:hypothetical protein
MAEGLKIENTHEAREFALARHVLRAVLAVLFAGVTVVLALQEVSVKTGVRWLLYLFLFVATDLIANAVIRRIAKQSGSR